MDVHDINRSTIKTSEEFQKICLQLVKQYTEEHLDKSDKNIPEVEPL